MTASELEQVLSDAKAAGINCSIGGSLLHSEGNDFSLPVTDVSIETVGKGSKKVSYLQAVLADGQSCSLKQLCQAEGLGLQGGLRERATTLLSQKGHYVVSEVRPISAKGRDGKAYETYKVKVVAK